MTYLLVLLLIASTLILLYQLMPYWASYKARGRMVSDLSGDIPETVLNKPRYVIYFWSPHCGMCQGMTPIIDRLMNHHSELAKVDISKALKAAHALGVSATPALVVVEKGVVERVALGVKSEQKILEILAVQ